MTLGDLKLVTNIMIHNHKLLSLFFPLFVQTALIWAPASVYAQANPLESEAQNDQIKDFKGAQNAGLNKLERINRIESYLSKTAEGLKSLQDDLEALKSLKLKKMKNDFNQLKQSVGQLKGMNGTESSDVSLTNLMEKIDQIEKVQLKKLNDDMARIEREEIEVLNAKYKVLQNTMKSLAIAKGNFDLIEAPDNKQDDLKKLDISVEKKKAPEIINQNEVK